MYIVFVKFFSDYCSKSACSKFYHNFSVIFIDLIIEFLNTIIFKKEGHKKQASFENKLPGLKLSIVRNFVDFSTIIYRAIISLKAICITLKRVLKTREYLLEWITAEEAEKNARENMSCFVKEMWINILAGFITLLFSISIANVLTFFISMCWIISPIVCCLISKKVEIVKPYELLNNKEQEAELSYLQKNHGK